jgi:hypothetical protein
MGIYVKELSRLLMEFIIKYLEINSGFGVKI